MIKYRVCRKQILHSDLKLVDARKKLSQYNNDNDEEFTYELEKYSKPKKRTRQFVKDKERPNLAYRILK